MRKPRRPAFIKWCVVYPGLLTFMWLANGGRWSHWQHYLLWMGMMMTLFLIVDLAFAFFWK